MKSGFRYSQDRHLLERSLFGEVSISDFVLNTLIGN